MTLKKWFTQCLIYAIAVIVLALLLALVSGKSVPKVFAPENAQASTVPQQPEEVKPDGIDLLMQNVLRPCESGGNDRAINPHDPVTPSFGRYQWKLDSAYHYNQIYHVLPDVEKAEMANVIMDADFQDRLTKAVLKDGGWRNWYNCLKSRFE